MRALPCALIGAVAIAGCGGGGDSKSKAATPAGTANPKAKAAAQQYLDAYAAQDPKAICATLTPKVQKQLADNKGTCVKTVRFSIKGQKFPHLVVAQAYANGGTARATINNTQRQITLQLVKGGWKVLDGGQ